MWTVLILLLILLLLLLLLLSALVPFKVLLAFTTPRFHVGLGELGLSEHGVHGLGCSGV